MLKLGTDEDCETVARKLRIYLGIDQQIFIDLIRVLRELKFRGLIADYIRVPDERMPDEEAKWDPDEKIL
jgi:hypothetical protein